MRILLVTPAPRGARNGNRTTALRWAALLRSLGHRVTVAADYSGGEWDLLVALHARKSAGAVTRFRAALPGCPIVVGLAGTDLYLDLPSSREALAALEMAWRIVALQPLAREALPEHLRPRVRAILQSARRPPGAAAATGAGDLTVCVVGHLREVKDPLLAAAAVRALPASSPIRVEHVGAALSPEWAARARAEERENPRWRWSGALTRRETLERIAAARLLVVTSRSEGGANVVSEAIACGVPVLSTRIAGSLGLLGEAYPGYFPVGDAGALAALLARCAADRAFLDELAARCRALAPLVAPERERDAWRALLDELGASRRLRLVDVGVTLDHGALERDVADGLAQRPRRLACRWFYDAEGSRLFEEICEQPEYYLPRVERALLERHADAIAARLPDGADLVELGSGNAKKTRLLLEALLRRRAEVRYLPVDISRAALIDSSLALLADYDGLSIVAVAADYTAGMKELRRHVAGPQLVVWLGSNIGNFDRAEAAAFLRGLRAHLGPDDRILVGADLRKARAILEAAYDDAAGVTARFNRNLLARVNRELGGDFDLAAFDHRAVYDEVEGRVEMYLVSRRAQRARVSALGRDFDFAEGEAIHTENSYKYSLAELDAVADLAGLRVEERFLDDERRFSLSLLAPRA